MKPLDASRTEQDIMIKKKVWFITGARRGMGADFATAALDASG